MHSFFTLSTQFSYKTRGVAIIEFIIGGAVTMLILMGMIQMLLAYRGSIYLQQATFEAVRAGITNHGRKDAITRAFIINSIDFHGGGQNATDIGVSYLRALRAVEMPLLLGGAGYHLRILNPTTEAFDDWSETRDNGRRFIPNTWQSIKPKDAGATSGVSIQDANILKIEITYGYPLLVPVIDRIIGNALTWLDPANIMFYQNSPVRLPLKLTALMHMQSDVEESDNESLRELIRPAR